MSTTDDGWRKEFAEKNRQRAERADDFAAQLFDMAEEARRATDGTAENMLIAWGREMSRHADSMLDRADEVESEDT